MAVELFATDWLGWLEWVGFWDVDLVNNEKCMGWPAIIIIFL